MKAFEIIVSLLLFAPTMCLAQLGIREDAAEAIKAAAGSTADPSEHQQKLAAVRLRLVQEATTARKEMERLTVDSASIKNRIDAAKFELNKLAITGISSYGHLEK